jgi:hypothetical protein
MMIWLANFIYLFFLLLSTEKEWYVCLHVCRLVAVTCTNLAFSSCFGISENFGQFKNLARYLHLKLCRYGFAISLYLQLKHLKLFRPPGYLVSRTPSPRPAIPHALAPRPRPVLPHARSLHAISSSNAPFKSRDRTLQSRPHTIAIHAAVSHANATAPFGDEPGHHLPRQRHRSTARRVFTPSH